MRLIAIGVSLQGEPEESIAHRVGGFLFGELQKAYPQHEIAYFNRSNYPGMGDAYSKLARDILAWGAGCAIHIHADSNINPAVYGTTAIYGNENGHALANYIYAAMAVLPTKRRGVIQQAKDAVLNKATPATIIEVGFYSNPAEYAKLQTDSYCATIARAIAHGATEYISRHLGINPSQSREEEEDMPALTLISRGGEYGEDGCVMGVGPVKAGQTLYAYGDANAHDFKARLYKHPFNGEEAKKDIALGGYANRDNVHGIQESIDIFGTLIIHSPYFLIGGVY